MKWHDAVHLPAVVDRMSQQGKPREDTDLQFAAYMVWVEGENDVYFTPEAVCIIYPDRVYKVFCLDSRHNFLRAAILKHPLSELLGDGLKFRDAIIRLEDLALWRTHKSLAKSDVRSLLRALYADNPRLYFFLARYA